MPVLFSCRRESWLLSHGFRQEERKSRLMHGVSLEEGRTKTRRGHGGRLLVGWTRLTTSGQRANVRLGTWYLYFPHFVHYSAQGHLRDECWKYHKVLVSCEHFRGEGQVIISVTENNYKRSTMSPSILFSCSLDIMYLCFVPHPNWNPAKMFWSFTSTHLE